MMKIKILRNKIHNHIMLRYKKIAFGDNLQINGRLLCRTCTSGQIILGNNIKINSGEYHNPVSGERKTYFETYPHGKIIVGNNVGISNSIIVSRECIRIEDNVLIGGGCQIYDNDFHSINYHMRIETMDDIKCKSVLIKEGAFIGASTIILKGVTIGKKSIVGAGSVVTHNIPDGEIWAGNPVHFIKRIEESDKG